MGKPIVKSRPVRTEGKPRKPWVFTKGRRESMEKAQEKHSILVSIGWKHLPEEARKLKPKGRSIKG